MRVQCRRCSRASARPRCRPPYGDIINADVAILAGTNTTANHPGRVLLLQAGQATRDDADRDRPAPRADRRARRHLLPDQARHRRRVLQRRDARGDPPRPRRPRVHRARVSNYGELAAMVRQYPPERAAQICGIDADTIRASRGSGAGRRGRHLLGYGDLPAHDGDRQRALPDRDVLDHRQRRPPGHRAAPAARAEQRAGRLRRRPDPDVLSRLPAGRTGRGRASASRRRGAASSTPRPA